MTTLCICRKLMSGLCLRLLATGLKRTFFSCSTSFDGLYGLRRNLFGVALRPGLIWSVQVANVRCVMHNGTPSRSRQKQAQRRKLFSFPQGVQTVLLLGLAVLLYVLFSNAPRG